MILRPRNISALNANLMPLSLQFWNPTKSLDPRITYARNSKAGRWTHMGVFEEVEENVARAHAYAEHDPASLYVSSSSVEIGHGTKTFADTVTRPVGTIMRATADGSNYVIGRVSASDGMFTTISARIAVGSGTHSSWTLINVLGFLVEGQRTNSIPYCQRPAVRLRLVITGTSGSFQIGETVTSTGGGSGIVLGATTVEVLIGANSGSFTGTLTGGTSGATATISSSAIFWSATAGGTGTIPVLTENAGETPDGSNSATRIIFDKGAGTTTGDSCNVFAGGYTTTAGQPQAAFIWLKSNTEDTYTIRLDFNGTATTGALATVTPEWKKFPVTLSSAADAVRVLSFRLRGSQSTSDYADILFWHAQQEQNALFATSEIVTAASATTRLADSAQMTGTAFSSWYNFLGTLVLNGRAPNAAATFVGASINDGTTDNEIRIGTNSSGANPTFTVLDGGESQASVAVTRSAGLAFKTAAAFKTDRFQQATNGTLGTAGTSGTVPTVDRLTIGARGDGSSPFFGTIAEMGFLRQDVADASLQTMSAP